MPAESYIVSLLVKLAAMASIASILARSNRFKSILLEENRTLRQRIELALWLAVVFGASVAMRIVGKTAYQGADLGLEATLFSVGNTQAYLASNDDHIVIAFRGTEAPTPDADSAPLTGLASQRLCTPSAMIAIFQ